MKRTKEMPTTTHTGSLNDWFDSIHYQRLYGHRNQTEAASFIDALIRQLDLAMEARLLDVGCGTGRHAKHLASKGFQVTGFDLAAASVRKAREANSPAFNSFSTTCEGHLERLNSTMYSTSLPALDISIPEQNT